MMDLKIKKLQNQLKKMRMETVGGSVQLCEK